MSQITIKDVAREAGVSTATVSYVINDTRPVMPERRQRVLDVIAKTNYQPSRVAKSLRTNKTNIIGVLTEDVLAFCSAHVINGISRYVEKTDYQILLYNLRLLDSLFNQYHQIVHNSEKVNKAISLLVGGANVDAVIYVGMFDRDLSGIISDIKKPIVVAYSTSEDEHVCSVSYENKDIAAVLMKHLIDLGHRRIALITGLAHTPPAQLRMQGIRCACRDAGLVIDEALIKYGDWEYSSGYKCMNELLQQGRDSLPTAVFVMNDLMAVGAMDAIREAGLRVPEDISLTGFDNREISEFVSPRLTTVEIDLEGIGSRAAEMTCQMLSNNGDWTGERSVTIPSKLILRDTTSRLST